MIGKVVTKDVEAFDETVDITPMIPALCRQVESLSYDIMFDYKDKLVEAVHAYNKVYREVQGSFGFSVYGTLGEGQLKIQPFSIAEIRKAIQDLNTHPDIDIRLVYTDPS